MNRVFMAMVALLALAACDNGNNGTDSGNGRDVVTDLGNDTAAGDPGSVDTGDRDTGVEDTGAGDPGPTDQAAADLGPQDTGPTDPGVQDPGASDPGPADLGPQDVATHPASHTENVNNSGVFHHPGKEDPLANCTGCHGADLTGGAGPSCYSCHNNDDHTRSRHGYMHLDASTSVCKNCHGPLTSTSVFSSKGGLGPACSECH
jgi:hypothetical protein